MRTIHQAFLAGGMAVLLGAGLAGTAAAATQNPTTSAAAAVAADNTRALDLAYSRDEERMARDLYTLFGQTYDAAIFDRIAASEQQHFDAVGTLPTTHAVADPATGQPAGTYANTDMQKLYDQWKAQGLTSVQDAYAVGVALEQTDIADLQGILANDPDADVQRVFTRPADRLPASPRRVHPRRERRDRRGLLQRHRHPAGCPRQRPGHG